jgi:surfeit locus 1 family protein
MTARRDPAPEPAPRGKLARVLVGAGALIMVLGFLALGTWQVQRLHWKLDLIARVDARVHAPAQAAPPSTSPVSAAADEYRHVRIDGRFLSDRDTYVQATTLLGAGYWLMTPLCRGDGSVVLINRGFVSAAPRTRARAHGPARCEAGPATDQVIGLLRMSEPETFLRHNDATADRWYARDVGQIAAARGLARVAPYFIDAEAGLSGDAGPVGGLTVIAFPNNHLQYALTWYAMALLSAGALLWNARPGRRNHQPD